MWLWVTIGFLSFAGSSAMMKLSGGERRQLMANEEYEIIFVAFITLKNGKRLYARNYGKTAFPIKVRKNRTK